MKKQNRKPLPTIAARGVPEYEWDVMRLFDPEKGWECISAEYCQEDAERRLRECTHLESFPYKIRKRRK